MELLMVLKPENILLNEDMHIQITDFGTAKVLSPESKQGVCFVSCRPRSRLQIQIPLETGGVQCLVPVFRDSCL